jgi:hypothetical protein
VARPTNADSPGPPGKSLSGVNIYAQFKILSRMRKDVRSREPREEVGALVAEVLDT